MIEEETSRAADAFVGNRAPDFTLQDGEGREWRLSDKRGRVVALLFYPGDETLVCTKQLCSVRDHWSEYVATGAEIVGVSRGTVGSHREFADHHNLPLTLLADIDGGVTRGYAKQRWMPSWMTRAIVVVDAEGIVRHRRIMFGAFRPRDKFVIAAIYSANFDNTLARHRERRR